MSWWKRTPEPQPANDTPAAGFPLIRLQRITRTFESDSEEPAIALKDVTVDIGRGEYVAVSGPSGCGKSTFLSILALLDTPTSGRYWLNGRATEKLSPAERARLRNVDIGLIFQSFNLIGDMTVYENVEYPLSVRGVAPTMRRACDAALERVGLAARAKQRPITSPAGISSSSPSPAPSPDGPPSSSPTSRRATSTRNPANPSCRCWTNYTPRVRRCASRRMTRVTSRGHAARSTYWMGASCASSDAGHNPPRGIVIGERQPPRAGCARPRTPRPAAHADREDPHQPPRRPRPRRSSGAAPTTTSIPTAWPCRTPPRRWRCCSS